MKRSHTLYPAIATLLLTVSSASCKPSEKSYREAYNTAVERGRSAEKEYLDSTALARMQVSERPQKMLLAGGDTLEYYPMRIVEVEQVTPADYSVAVGRFRQVFNAREMRERLRRGGFPEPFIVGVGDNNWMVCTATTMDADSAYRQLKQAAASDLLSLKAPFPLVMKAIIRPPRR